MAHLNKIIYAFTQPEVIISYIIISIIATIIHIRERFKKQQTVPKSEIFYSVLISFLPCFNVIIAFFGTLFWLFELSYDYNEKQKVKEKPLEEIKKDRTDYVFGFLKYKGIEISELDDYIESRKLLQKMLDKIE